MKGEMQMRQVDVRSEAARKAWQTRRTNARLLARKRRNAPSRFRQNLSDPWVPNTSTDLSESVTTLFLLTLNSS